MRTFLVLIASFFLSKFMPAQDSLYTREVISYLCNKKCFGRGYVKNGLYHAEKFIIGELKKEGIQPLLAEGYTQAFPHSVNTFPGKVKVKVNGRKLKPGIDYILDPASTGIRGKYKIRQLDSVTFADNGAEPVLILKKKKKLTYGVARQPGTSCTVELDAQLVTGQPETVSIKVKNKHEKAFTSKNIVAYNSGSSESDSMLVFTAHYDHLGGMGCKTFFPGANDNASGVSMVLNLAKHYTKNPHRYKCVFIFFAGEEAGLLGSAFFVKSGVLDLGKIKFLINLDLLGTGEEGMMAVNGAIHEDEFNTLSSLNNTYGLVKQVKKRGKAANSDHYYFSEAGVPAFFIYTMGGTAAYHDVNDVPEKLSLSKYRNVFQLLLKFTDAI